MPYRSQFRWVVLLATVMLVTACSSTPEDPAYYAATSVEALAVPPDLNKPIANEDFLVPAGPSVLSAKGSPTQKEQLLPAIPKMTIVRDGALQWLSVEEPAEKVWADLKAFFSAQGFNIVKDNLSLGVLETDWQQDRITKPGNWFSAKFSSVFGDDQMDQFHISLERDTGKGKTLVFVQHRGMVATEKDGVSGWAPRAVDPGLESEVLRRFMLFRGLDANAAQALFAEQGRGLVMLGKDTDGAPQIEVRENFARTWRRVGLAMDRLGFLVEDRNRTAGVYYLRLPEGGDSGVNTSWFAQFSGVKQLVSKEGLLLKISEKDAVTQVQLRDRAGKPLEREVAQRILQRIKDQMI